MTLPAALEPAMSPAIPGLHVLVLTGGPCGGKSSVLSVLRQKLATAGIPVFVVPELATEIFSNGVDVPTMLETPDRWRGLQTEIVRAQIDREAYWRRLAELHPAPTKLLICDRGVMDGGAYIGPEMFAELLHDLGLSTEQVRDARYDAVLHMVTAAKGAPEAYTTANNEARRESAAEAAELDDKTLACWLGHRNLHVIANARPAVGPDGVAAGVERVSFEEKKAWALREVCRMLGLPVPSRVEEKFEIEDPGDLARYGVRSRTSTIEQVYLVDGADGVERKIRKVTGAPDDAAAGTIYTYGEKRRGPDGTAVRTERVIRARDYRALLAEAAPDAAVLRKQRTCFTYGHLYFILDRMADATDAVMLEVETTEDQPTVVLPPWIQVRRRVTGEVAFRNATLARRAAGVRPAR